MCWGGPCGRLLESVLALAGSWAITKGPDGTLEHPKEPPGVPVGAAGSHLGLRGRSLGGSTGAPPGLLELP